MALPVIWYVIQSFKGGLENKTQNNFIDNVYQLWRETIHQSSHPYKPHYECL